MGGVPAALLAVRLEPPCLTAGSAFPFALAAGFSPVLMRASSAVRDLPDVFFRFATGTSWCLHPFVTSSRISTYNRFGRPPHSPQSACAPAREPHAPSV